MARQLTLAVTVALFLAFLILPSSGSSILSPAKYWKNNLASSIMTREGEDYRLPTSLVPTLYNIRLLPFIEEGNFTTKGYIEVWFDCVEATQNITMHSIKISVDWSSASVVDVETNQHVAVENWFDEQDTREMITIQTDNQLTSGKQYKISFTFTSLLNTDYHGFYRSSYLENGVTKYLAATQMEPAHARKAFPCFDEPNLKANFTITLGRKKSMTSTSNMPLEETIPMDGMPDYEWDVYETSLKMPTYLVAMVVSDFTSVQSDPSLSNIKFGVISRPDAINQTKYAGDIGPRLMEFYESYLGIDYPLEKEDMIAIPGFGGAMENWGLVTYGEQFLL